MSVATVIPLRTPARVRIAVLNSTVVPESLALASEQDAAVAIDRAKQDPTATYVALYVDGAKVESYARSFSRKGIAETWKRLK